MAGRCVIIGAGDLSVSEIPLHEGDYVIAADGGFSYCRYLEIEPDLILGDFDSVDERNMEDIMEMRARYPEKMKVLPVEKDDTDMLAAIKEGLNKGFEEFVIYGGQGGRLAHTMANIQCLNYLKEKGAKGYLMDGNGMILVAKNETVRFKKNLEGFLSLFSLGEKAEGVTITNMKYLLDKAVVTNDFPIGVSNEFIGKESSVTVENGTLLIMIDWN